MNQDAAFWNDRYRSKTSLWSGEPNVRLVEETSALTPGSALDAGCGEGADAIWLARRGWRVIAIDISAVALERAQAVQIERDVARRIAWIETDLLTDPPPRAAYDLVSAQFMHAPPDVREQVFRHLAAAVAPSGTLLVVGHHPSDLETGVRRPPHPELLYAPDDIVALLPADEWEIIVADVRPREAADADDRPVTVRDTVVRAIRSS